MATDRILFVWIYCDDDVDPSFQYELPPDTPKGKIVEAIETFYGHLNVRSFEIELGEVGKYNNTEVEEEEEEEEEQTEAPDIQQQLAEEVTKTSTFPKRKAKV